jgi:hypothetical protein
MRILLQNMPLVLTGQGLLMSAWWEKSGFMLT